MVIRILRNKNFILKDPYEAYIKSKFIISPNYNPTKTYYTEFGDYIFLDLFRLVLISVYKYIKYLFTLLDTVTRWLDFRLLKIKIKSEALNTFKEMKISTKN